MNDGQPLCEKCPFAVDGKPACTPVKALIPEVSLAVLVTEFPADRDAVAGFPLSSGAGWALREEAERLGVRMKEVACLTATACPAPYGATPTQMTQAVKACRPKFRHEMYLARQAKVRSARQPVLLMGKYAGQAFTTHAAKTKKERGFIRTSLSGNYFIHTWGPRHALHVDHWRKGELLADVARWWGLAVGTRTLLRPFIHEMSVRDAVRMARVNGYVAVDIETTFDTIDAVRLKTVGLGWTSGGVSYEWEKLSGEDQGRLADLMCDPTVTKVLMNGYWFDIRVLNRHGMHFENVEDIRDSRRALDPTSALSLSYQASLYLDMKPWKEDEEDDEKGVVHTEDMVKLRAYNATDCVVTALLREAHKKEPEWRTKRVQRLYGIHKETSQLAAEMHSTGWQIDRQRMTALSAELLSLHESRREALYKAVDQAGWTGTPEDMRALIYRRHAEPGKRSFNLADPEDPKMYTDISLDTCAVNKGSLLQLVIDPTTPEELKHIIDLYWHFAAPRKARQTYLESDKVQKALGADNRMRPGWNSCGTETMRWSCSAPNIMNLSQEKKEDSSLIGALPNIRQIYTAKPGYLIVGADWSQQEIRIMECISGDAALKKALDSGDFYSDIARTWFGLPADCNVKKENPQARQTTKIIYLAAQYWASLGTVYRQYLMQDRTASYNKVRVLYDKGFLKTFTGIQAYWESEFAAVNSCGYSEGRLLQGRRYYPAPPSPNMAVNFPVQRTAGEMGSLAMLAIREGYRKSRIRAALIGNLHDAFYSEVHEQDVEKAKRIITDSMCGPWTINGQTRVFPVDIKVGRYWSELG